MVADPVTSNREKERLARKQLSSERMKQWPNTLAALRQKKEDQRLDRENQEEQKRIILDKKNAERKAKIRAEQIRRANELMYAQTDQMKVLNSGLLLSDVLSDREAQISMKKTRKSRAQEREELRILAEERKLLASLAQDEADEMERTAKNKRIAAEQKQQLADYRDAYIARLREEKTQGEEIVRKAELEFIEDQQKKELVRRRARQNALELREANEALKEVKRQQKRKEEEEDAAAAAHATRKEELVAERKRREDAKFQADQATRQRMIDEAVRRLDELRKDEGQRLNKQEQQVRQKEEESLEKKLQQQAQQMEAIRQSRDMQMALRKQKADNKKLADAEFSTQWKQWNSVLEEEQRCEAEKASKGRKEHQRELKRMIRQKRKGKQEERQAALADAQAQAGRVREDDLKFQAHAAQQLQRWEGEGKNVVPLKNSLSLLGERLMAAN